MPKAHDLQRLTITHDPTKRMDMAVGNLPKLFTPPEPGAFATGIIGLIEAFTGVNLADPHDWPIWGTIVEVLTGKEDGDVHDFGTFLNNLLRRDRAVPKVTGGIVGDENPELLITPDFRASGSVQIKDNWTWTDEAGYDALGCAKVDAAGYLSELLSNEIPVTGGQTVLKLSVKVKWTGHSLPLPTTLPTVIGGTDISYTGTNPIAMGVTRYLDRTEIGSEDLAVVATPAGTSDWIELYDDLYEVPSDCDEIRMRFKVGANLAAGSVFWDDASVTAVGMGLIDRIVQGLENQNTPGWNYVDLFLALLNTFRTTADHASRITYLELLTSPGNKINDEFLRTGSTLGANWNVSTVAGAGAGTWQTDGDYAFWQDSGFGDKELLARYVGSPSTTSSDTQQIIAVLGSRGQDFPLIAVHSYFDLYGRMDTGQTNWIRARFRSDGVITLATSISGTITTIATTTSDPVSAGATIILTCGTSDGTRFFRVDVNGVAKLGGPTAPVSDSTSNFGASYRGYGMGVRAEGSILLLGQATPPSINAWAAKDN